MSRWAFSDESERASRMLLGVLTIQTSDVGSARRVLRGLLLPGQRRVHTAKESPRRRRLLLDAVAGLDVSVIVFELTRSAGLSRVEARRALLAAACRHVADLEVAAWHLDAEDPAQAGRDRRVIDQELSGAGVVLPYDHRSAHEEPLLWAVDAVVWAAGAGPVWSARVRHRLESRRVDP